MKGFRLAPQQRRLFQLDDGGPSYPYRTGGVFRLTGELDHQALDRCFRELVERYEILRTTFPPVPGLELPLQLPGARSEATIALASPPVEGEAAAGLHEIVAADDAIDLSSERLLSVRLIQVGAADHLLVWLQASLCGDHSSVVNLVDELLRRYAARTGGEEDEEPLQYADLAEWLNEILEDEAAADGIAHWRRQADSIPAVRFPLETAVAGSGERRFRPSSIAVTLATGTETAMRQRAADLELPLECLLQALWATLLSRYVDSESLCLDTLYDGRSYEGLEEAVGLFARYLPTPIESSDADTVDDLALRLATRRAEAAEWQEYFDAERAQRPRQPTTYGFSFFTTAARQYGDVLLQPLSTHSTLEPHLLELACCESQGDLGLDIVFDVARLSATHAEALATSFAALAADSTRRPAQRVDQLLLGDEEQLRALVAPPESTPEPPSSTCVVDPIGQQATERPDHPATICGETTLSYAELWHRAGGVARHLQEAGVEPDELVAVCCERSVDLVVAVLGVLRSGGAYLPLDPAYPIERLDFMVRDATARLALFHAPTADRVAELPVEGVDLATLGDGEPGERADTSGNDLAYVIYTSGSTGQPKGVAVTQSNLAHSTAARGHFYPAPPRRFLLLSSYAFDSSVVGLFWTLANGGTLILPQEGTEQDVGLIASTIEDHDITHTLCLPTLYTLLLEQASGEQLSSLEVVAVAGEACSASLVRRHFELRPTALLVNEYGPTEATVWAIACVLSPEAIEPSVPIGEPVPYAQAYLVDTAGQPVPPGIVGEIHLGGAGIARGYLGRPELTAEAFRQDPFSGSPGARIYRTGDRGRRRQDGQIEFLGRVDHQVKIRGYRIEPGEIEARLGAHEAIRQAVVVPRRGASGDLRLVAYLVAGDSAMPNVSQLRTALQEHLPDYMIPAAFVTLDEMPLTPTGKVDRNTLPEPEQQRPDLAADYEPAGSDTETYLVAKWEEILQTEPIGVRDNFFELGGNSIQAAVFMNRIRGEIDEFIHVGRLFEHPTIRELATHLEQEHAEAIARLQGQQVTPTPLIEPGGEGDAIERVAGMSDDEVDSMLEELLSEEEHGT